MSNFGFGPDQTRSIPQVIFDQWTVGPTQVIHVNLDSREHLGDVPLVFESRDAVAPEVLEAGQHVLQLSANLIKVISGFGHHERTVLEVGGHGSVASLKPLASAILGQNIGTGRDEKY